MTNFMDLKLSQIKAERTPQSQGHINVEVTLNGETIPLAKLEQFGQGIAVIWGISLDEDNTVFLAFEFRGTSLSVGTHELKPEGPVTVSLQNAAWGSAGPLGTGTLTLTNYVEGKVVLGTFEFEQKVSEDSQEAYVVKGDLSLTA